MARGVLLVDRERVEVDPVHSGQLVAVVRGLTGTQVGQKPRGAPAHFEESRQQPRRRAAGLDALAHRDDDPVKGRPELVFAHESELVGFDDVGDPHALAFAMAEQLGRARVRVRGRRGRRAVPSWGERARLRGPFGVAALLHDESAAHRIVCALAEDRPVFGEGADSERVDVEGKDLSREEENVAFGCESDLPRSGHAQDAGAFDVAHNGVDDVNRHALGGMAGEAEHDGPVRRMAFSRGAQGTHELDDDAPEPRLRRDSQMFGEVQARPHGADRVRGGRADSHAKHVPDGQGARSLFGGDLA